LKRLVTLITVLHYHTRRAACDVDQRGLNATSSQAVGEVLHSVEDIYSLLKVCCLSIDRKYQQQQRLSDGVMVATCNSCLLKMNFQQTVRCMLFIIGTYSVRQKKTLYKNVSVFKTA